MCMFNLCVHVLRRCSCAVILIGIALLATYSHAQDNAGFGRLMSANELAELPVHVFADGTGLPAGEGNAVQGEQLYSQQCADCHGSVGQGGRAVELVGDRALLATNIPDKGIGVYWPYAPTLFEYIRRAMPPENPYSLSVGEVYSVVAHLLVLNELAEPEAIVDAAFLSELKMPNRDGFRSAFDF